MPEDGSKQTALDKLLSGLDAMAEKLNGISKRQDQIDAMVSTPKKALTIDEDDDLPDKALAGGDPDEVGDLPPESPPDPGAPKPAAADSLNTIRGRRAKLAQFQARADSVCALMGSTAPRPLEGESVNGYARRILRPWAKFSDEWKGIDLGTLRGPTLGVAASAIMKAAADEAKCPQVPHGMLMERKRSDGAGHFITTFHGNPSAWMSRFSGPRRYVKQINMKPSNGYSAN